ncbi:MAG: diacylglycerol kinase family protein [Candidatus Chisholmbacteria bacterium]|nr:diacylglycerol kinase family protein [Candidatus Chisholmbacteria bacterium]
MAHGITFKHALEGIKYAFSTQPNFRVHGIIALAVILAGLFFGLSPVEWLIIIFTFSLVFTTEMINTALESMTDLIEEKNHQSAKIAKDVSAGMVLISALAAVVVGLVIFIPKLLALSP